MKPFEKEIEEQKRLFKMQSEQMNSKSIQETVDEIMSDPVVYKAMEQLSKI